MKKVIKLAHGRSITLTDASLSGKNEDQKYELFASLHGVSKVTYEETSYRSRDMSDVADELSDPETLKDLFLLSEILPEEDTPVVFLVMNQILTALTREPEIPFRAKFFFCYDVDVSQSPRWQANLDNNRKQSLMDLYSDMKEIIDLYWDRLPEADATHITNLAPAVLNGNLSFADAEKFDAANLVFVSIPGRLNKAKELVAKFNAIYEDKCPKFVTFDEVEPYADRDSSLVECVRNLHLLALPLENERYLAALDKLTAVRVKSLIGSPYYHYDMATVDSHIRLVEMYALRRDINQPVPETSLLSRFGQSESIEEYLAERRCNEIDNLLMKADLQAAVQVLEGIDDDVDELEEDIVGLFISGAQFDGLSNNYIAELMPYFLEYVRDKSFSMEWTNLFIANAAKYQDQDLPVDWWIAFEGMDAENESDD